MAHMLQQIVHQLGRAAACEGLARIADAELLRRFVADRDALAFEAIVWRHGAMVLDTCRRVRGEQADAEDAFQATFLTLVRQAHAVRGGESLAGWLYRVARRLSVRQSRQARSRGRREARAARVEGVIEHDVERADWLQWLDGEIERLPARFREAFILCHLEGRTHEDAARELGCPLGTLHSRLARAKERLRARLKLGGVAFPIVAVAGVSPRLVNAAVKAAGSVAEGSAIATVTTAVALSHGGWSLMAFVNAKCLAVAVLALATIGSGAVLLNQPVARATPVATAPARVDPTLEELKRENARLREEVAVLKKRVAELQPPPALPVADAPTDAEVLAAFKKTDDGRAAKLVTNVTIVKNPLRVVCDQPKFYPIVGLAQLRRECWECAVYYVEDVKNVPPEKRPRVQVVYIDRDKLVPVAERGK